MGAVEAEAEAVDQNTCVLRPATAADVLSYRIGEGPPALAKHVCAEMAEVVVN